MQRQEDWYAYLRLSPQAPEEQIAQVLDPVAMTGRKSAV